MRRRFTGATVGGALLVAFLATIAFAWSDPRPTGPRGGGPVAFEVRGAMRAADSLAGQAILSASNLAPGGAVVGTVAIRNDGGAGGALALEPRNLADLPGPAGGTLSSELELTVRDISGHSDAIVYSGRLAAMERREIGFLEPGDRRLYRFVASLPDVPTNALQAAGLSVDYRWSLVGASRGTCEFKLVGGARPNQILGSAGGDRIAGGPGPDRLFGAEGQDCLSGGPGPDSLSGGPGNDIIWAHGGGADSVNCGPGGDDVAYVDPADTAVACERLIGPLRNRVVPK
jgi:Ca2+-binding RTX toxin-like protein